MKNKFAKFATNASASSILLWFIGGVLRPIALIGILAGLAGTGFAIKGLIEYNKDKTIGGAAWCVIAILVGLLFAYMSLRQSTLLYYLAQSASY